MAQYTIVGEDRDCNGIEVEITRRIRVGQMMRINASEAFLGIESGVIQVVAIVPGKPDADEIYSDLQDPDNISTGDFIAVMEAHKEACLDLMEGTEYYEEEVDRMDREPWIVYRYQRNESEWSVLPLEEFIDHTMYY